MLNSTEDIRKAQSDAMLDAPAKATPTTWGFAGFFLGVFGIIWAALYIPKPDMFRFEGMSNNYISAYTQTFRSAVRTKQVVAALIGSAVWFAILAVLFYVWFFAELAAQPY